MSGMYMDAATYWKFRAKMTELNQAAERLNMLRAQVYAEAGLDPAKNYNLDDAKCEIVEIAAPSIPQASAVS